MIQAKGVAGGMRMDVIVAEVLPGTVIQGQIVVVSRTQPGMRDGAIRLDTVQPALPEDGDIWISMGKGGALLHWEYANKNIVARPAYVKQAMEGQWRYVDAYIGTDGAWEQFSIAERAHAFTYTGEMSEAEEVAYSDGIYQQVKLLSSGLFTAQEDRTIDLFAVGGGGSGCCGNTGNGVGGGGGYTATAKTVQLRANQQETVVVGAGGAKNGSVAVVSGGETSFGTLLRAAGGIGGEGTTRKPGDGGSGGGHYRAGNIGFANGGTDGGDGSPLDSNPSLFGAGQGRTTRAFEDTLGDGPYGGGGGGCTSNPEMYFGLGGAHGGGNGSAYNKTQGGDGLPHTGGGGGGGGSCVGTPYYGGAGGSGVVILRWRVGGRA